MEEVVLQEPLSELTAVIVVDIFPGTLTVIENCGGGLGRPRIDEDES
jgi:hypothetical protein